MSVKKMTKKTVKSTPKGKVGQGVKEATKLAGKEIIKEVAKQAVRGAAKMITHNHANWWDLPAKLHTGINFSRPTKVYESGGIQPLVEITNVNSVFTYPLNTSESKIDAELYAIANQVIKQIRLDLRSNLNYSVTDVARYLQVANALNIEFENIIKLLRLTMSANTKVQNFSRLATSTYNPNSEDTPLATTTSMFDDMNTVQDYLSRIIRLLTDVRGVTIPKKLYERNTWLFGNIFTDETNKAKTQYYVNYVGGTVATDTDSSLYNVSTIEGNDKDQFYASQSIDERFESIKTLVRYAVGTGTATYNFGTIAADLDKSAIETIDLGTGCFDKVNTLKPIDPIYDSTYFRALDNTQMLESIIQINGVSITNHDRVLVDIDQNSLDPASIASAVQFTWAADWEISDINAKLSEGLWITDNGWIIPLGCYGVAATTAETVSILFRPSVKVVVLPDNAVSNEKLYMLALMSTVDHYMYPIFGVYAEGIGDFSNLVYTKEISMRAQINNLVLRDIKYMANLGLVINANLA